MVFKILESDITKSGQSLSIFRKEVRNVYRDFLSAVDGIKNKTGDISQFSPKRIFGNKLSQQDIQAIHNYNEEIKKYNQMTSDAVSPQTAFYRHLGNSSAAAQQLARDANGAAVSEELLTQSTNELTFAQKALTVMSKAMGVALRTALNFGIGLLISLIITGITKLVNRQKELAEQIKETAKKVSEEEVALSNLISKYSEFSDKVTYTAEEKETLLEIQDSLIDTFGAESDALDLVNGKYEEQLEKIKQLSKEKLKQDKSSLIASRQSAYESTTQNSLQIKSFKFSSGIFNDGLKNTFDEITKEINDEFKRTGIIGGGISKIGKAYIGNLVGIDSGINFIGNAEDRLKEIRIILEKMEKYDSTNNSFYKDLVAYEQELQTIADNYTTSTTDLAKNIFETYKIDNSIETVGKDNYATWKMGLLQEASGDEDLKIQLAKLIKSQFADLDNYFENYDIAKNMFLNSTPNMYNEKGVEERESRKKFLEELSDKDLAIAIQIPDLFADGLDGASKKIQEFKADPNNSIAPSFDYSTYSEQVDTVVKNLDKVQSAIDKLNEGKGIDGKDITELANTFPEYSSEILSASDNTEKLKAVLKDIKSDAPSSLIDTLTNLKDLSEEDQNAVNGLITILSRLTNESATYADTLSDLDTKESLMSTAYKEMHDDGQISISTYQKLISLGDDYADLISIVDGKLIVNAKSIRDLTDAKYADEIATLKLAKAELEYSIAGNVGNADSYIERINAINEEIKAKEKARDLLSGFDYTTTAKKDKDEKPERVLAFEKELAKREHEINMGLREEDDAYYDWLLSAAHTAYDGLKDYQDELWKHEETVYKWRKDKEQELFDEKIENIKTLADKALDSKNVYTELSKEQKELAEFNKKMQSEFGLGNVDLTKRPKVAMDDGSTATVLSSSEFLWQGDEENGHYVAVHYTPILPDGTVLEDDTLAKYLYETLEGSDDILKADTKGIVLKVDAGLNITDEDIASLETGNYTENIQNIIKECDDWDVALHNIQEEWLKVSEAAENSTSITLTRFEYARNQITGAISEIQKRINDIQEGRLAGNADDIKALNDELTDLRKTLADINKDELEYELDNEKAYWEDLKSKQEDIYDKEIDKLEKVKDAISKKNEEEEKATDLAEKQLALEKAKLELEKARQNRSVMLVTKQGTFYTADQSAIDEAEKNVKDAEKDIADAKKDDVTDKISEQIDVLKEQKENTQNYYDTIIKLLEDSQNDPLQAEANRDLWGKILATENGQNAIASADQDQVNKLIENGFLAFNDGKYSLNNPNAEVPKDSQTITKSDITDVLTTVFGKKEGYTPEKIASIAEKFEEKTHLLYDGFTPSDVVNKATENINKTINNSQVINKVQNMNTTYHIDKIEVGYSGNDFEGLLADTIDAINQGIIVNRNKILHGR